MRTGRFACYMSIIILLRSLLSAAQLDPEYVPHTILFEGRSEGGTVIIAKRTNQGYERVEIKTEKGETRESVAERLVRETARSDATFTELIRFEGDSLRVDCFPGMVFLAGTESGLGRTPAPVFLSGHYDAQCRAVNSCWANPVEYGFMYYHYYNVVGCYAAGPMCIESASCQDLGDSLTAGVLKPVRMILVAYQNHLPSGAAHITISTCRQQELDAVPFVAGIAPNWLAWMNQEDMQASVVLAEGRKEFSPHFGDFFNEREPRQVAAKKLGKPYSYDDPADEPLYQSLKTTTTWHGPGGVYRRFLGLTPGHAYRVLARMNTFTLDADVEKGAWSFSIHTCYDKAGGEGITMDQIAGRGPLPDGTMGPEAGCIARFGSGGAVTSGQWREVSTGAENPGKAVDDILLPEGVESLTVWLRLESQREVEVGMDWIALDDLTCAQYLAQTPPDNRVE